MTSSPFALWPLRLGLSAVFLYAGIEKLADLEGTERLFQSLGIPLPGVAAPLVGAVEMFGGLALLVGLMARSAAVLLAGIMVGAIAVARLPGPFFDGWAFDLVLLAGLLTVALEGPGRPRIGGASAPAERAETVT
ncbi:MAG: DoxX family protein [Thermoplasmatota archaeon]